MKQLLQVNREVPLAAVEAFVFALEYQQRGINQAVEHKEWYASHTEGVITVRRADLVRRPLHDLAPGDKR